MSAPTKIYLVLVAAAFVVWMGVSTFVVAKDPGPRYITDMDYLLDNSERFTAMLRGRVDVRDVDGKPISPPEGTLIVDVRARDAEGTLAVQRIGSVQPDGVFEVLSLPHGLATVSIQLGGGETIWEREDIVVGGAGTLDPRIDPIDLGDELFFFEVEVRGPSGGPATTGQLAWRKVGTQNPGDDVSFDGLAPIGADGVARFFCTTAVIDAVCMVPGARTELFEELYLDSSIDLGPGISVELVAAGELPDSDRWSLRAVLTPVKLAPKIELSGQGLWRETLDPLGTPVYVELDAETGTASLPLARGGSYRIRWGALGARRHRFNTIKLPEGEIIEIPSTPGAYRVESTFPIEAFLRKSARGR